MPNIHKKSEYSSLIKEILFKVFLPQVFYVFLLVIIHWLIATLWVSLNYNVASDKKLILVSLLSGLIPLVTYILWGIRRFLMKGYLIFHKRIVSYWIQDFSNTLADEIVRGNYLKNLKNEQNTVLSQFKTQLFKKMNRYPKYLQSLMKFILNKIGVDDSLDQQIKLIENGNIEEVALFLNQKISKLVLKANENLFPNWVAYLIPINTILFLVLWFL